MTFGYWVLGAGTARPGCTELGCITICRRIVECGDAVSKCLPYSSMSGCGGATTQDGDTRIP